jgi:dCMP deaminase
LLRRRLDKDTRFLAQALVVSTGATCARRRVGCILVNKAGIVLSTGCNGPASGEAHCIDHPCPGAEMASGTGLGKCEAVHAEQNALMQCEDVSAIDTAYCTTSPCEHCVKMLLNTGCLRVVFLDAYPGSEESRALWVKSKVKTGWTDPSNRGTLYEIQRQWVHYVPMAQPAGGHMIRAVRDAIAIALDGQPET